jgi:hypothetical protein
MFYELRTYTLQVGKVPEYVKLFEVKGLHVITRYLPMAGWFTVDTGELNQIVHIWRYESVDDRTERRRRLYEDKEWTEGFAPLAFPIIVSQKSVILHPTSFSPMK